MLSWEIARKAYFVGLFYKYVLSAYYVLATLLGTEMTVVNKRDISLASCDTLSTGEDRSQTGQWTQG